MEGSNLLYGVKKISREQCTPYILGIHYAKRWPSISYAFGLYANGILCGVVTYGTPPSSSLRKGVAGEFYIKNVLELNRLCLKHNRQNEASRLVGKSLRLLPKNKIIVSFADIGQNHLGWVYQATNFLYTGLSAKRTDWKIRGKEHLHGCTIGDEFRGKRNRAQLMREKYGDNFYLAPRSRKHRYIFIHGDKAFKKSATAALKYKIQDYPKTNEKLIS